MILTPFWRAAALGMLLVAAACSTDKKPEAATATVPLPIAATAAVAVPAEKPAAVAPETAPSVPAGFDPGAVPVSTATVGAFPFVSLLDGYKAMTRENSSGNSTKDYLKDVAFDQYEFFDGTKLIPVEGRLYTVRAMGKEASFFQVQKTYETLLKGLGGVTVFEGPTKKMKELKLAYGDPRHRSRYMPENEKMGVYMARLPDREIWVETYSVWDDANNYWLTVVEKKGLPMQATVLPAAEMKKALDATGHVALYLNFDTDQATLKPDAQATIAQIISLLAQSPDLKLAVQGHTDNLGTPQHNQELSEARARTVVATLAAQGIAADRLQAAGFGQTKPLADNATEEGKAKNRRVELVKL
ncbi:OmpA family protein [Hymenobacter tibetensis]|uniref:OmpA family protein n=1 Tax=Hymenobacter tibetensis TaxID=497967 RepID=A0ABY4D0B5_9BACT|nr:OmpA family protein [Hymenobacter tibetensis]UOG75707.1 OmpA family protein [Hymenobacter tibetensis]